MRTIHFEGKEYQISSEAMPEELKEKLSVDNLKHYLELLHKVQIHPRKVYTEVKEFCHQHLHVPEVVNLLTFSHIQNHRILEAEKLIENTYLDYPEYLFARINYADQCIRKKNLEKIPEIFPTFDLSKLCPEKKVFHTSEFRGFLIMMTYYFLSTKEREKAIHYFKVAEEIEPQNPNVLYLKKKLYKRSFFQRLFRRKN